MSTVRGSAASVAVSAAIDVGAVLLFALIGRASHNEGPLGLLITAWPFLAGLAIGWLVMRAWRHPRRILWTGIGIWVVTVAGGMLLRVASDQGTALPFIIIATLTLCLALVGWRAVALLITRLRQVRRATESHP